jgi:hypothetical protein
VNHAARNIVKQFTINAFEALLDAEANSVSRDLF